MEVVDTIWMVLPAVHTSGILISKTATLVCRIKSIWGSLLYVCRLPYESQLCHTDPREFRHRCMGCVSKVNPVWEGAVWSEIIKTRLRM